MPAATCFDGEILDETLAGSCAAFGEQRSRLSKNLREILSDKNCLSYFVQFLDAKNALSPIKFFLDAESFKTAADLSISSSKTNVARKSGGNCDNCDSVSEDCSPVARFRHHVTREITKSVSSEGYDSLSFNSFDICDRLSNSSQSEGNLRDTGLNNVNEGNDIDEDAIEIQCDNAPELKNLYDLSMKKPLTDDEKSRICVETNKRTKQRHSTEEHILNSLSYTAADCRNASDVSDRSVVSDSIRIYKKYLITNSPCFIHIPSAILSNISLALCGQQEDGKMSSSISADCFEEAQNYVLEQLELSYLNEFLESVFYCRYCMDILTNSSLTIVDILYSESALFYFMEYLEQECKRNCLDFWMAATNFRRHYKSLSAGFSKADAQNDAMVLYDKYFSLQASCPLRISDSVRSHIEESICADNDDVAECFDLPLRIIEGYFNKYYFNDFLSSPLFAKYLNELRTRIDDNEDPDLTSQKALKRRTRHRKTLSDCTGDNTKCIRKSFISQQNTLLAMESTRPKGKTTNLPSGDMQIDSRLLTNPDLLWHRKNCATNGPLTFGRVDSMGRYERDFEPSNISEDKWSLTTGGNRLKNAVRKLVNLPEDKVQEEIAWQVAEMIVKDVTNITLGSSDSNVQNDNVPI